MEDLNIDILINKENPLDLTYVPIDMYILDDNENNFHNYLDPTLKPMLRTDVKPYVDKLICDAKKSDIYLLVDSGYRSSDYQISVLKNLIIEKGDDAYKYVSLPGASEHQSGLAIDFAFYQDGIYCDDLKEDDKQFIWLCDNAWKYGFILRYPKGKESITGFSFEPWHFRFVGVSLADYLYHNNLTLEEYYNQK